MKSEEIQVVQKLLDNVLVALTVEDSIHGNISQAVFDDLTEALARLERSFYVTEEEEVDDSNQALSFG